MERNSILPGVGVADVRLRTPDDGQAERLPETCSHNTNKIGIRCICWFYSQGNSSSIFLILVSNFICVYSQQWCVPEHTKSMEVYAGCLNDKRDCRISDRHKNKNIDTKYVMTSVSDKIRTVKTINLREQFMETMHITSSSIFDTPRQRGN